MTSSKPLLPRTCGDVSFVAVVVALVFTVVVAAVVAVAAVVVAVYEKPLVITITNDCHDQRLP